MGEKPHPGARSTGTASSSRTSARSISASCSSHSSERRMTMVRFELGLADRRLCDVVDVSSRTGAGSRETRGAGRPAARQHRRVLAAPRRTSLATVRFHHQSTLARRAHGSVDRSRRGRRARRSRSLAGVDLAIQAAHGRDPSGQPRSSCRRRTPQWIAPVRCR